MRNLENRCCWKGVAETSLAEGKLKECKKCDGYNVGCSSYFSDKEKETKLRVYKLR